ncbi:MAG: glycosyltransferase family 2 protein [Pseudomonadota bacterium]
MAISVIIPVYNAEEFLRAAVFSAVQQKEVGEILLIDDGSQDGSLKVCYQAAADYDNVRVLQHPHGAHLGLAASRNLGIREANYDFIAFLDADDYYLPKRFGAPFRTLALRPEIDCVYEGVETFFEPESHRDAYMAIHGKTLVTMDAPYVGNDLFSAIASGRHGYPSLVGLLVRKESLLRVGLFNEQLEMHDNTALILKLAALTSMTPGRINKPVTRRRVHTNNKSLTTPWDLPTMWQSLWKWARHEARLSDETYNNVLRHYLLSTLGETPENHGRRRAIRTIREWMSIVNKYPHIIKRGLVWRYIKQALRPLLSRPKTVSLETATPNKSVF